MLTESDKRVLEIFRKNLLTTKSELKRSLQGREDGTDISIQRLRDMGYIDKVESLGTCFVITQKGMRILKEFE